MAKCSACNRTVVEANYGQGTILLDPIPATYSAVESAMLFADDGDRVFRSLALVEHHVVCPAAIREQAQRRKQYKAAHEQQGE